MKISRLSFDDMTLKNLEREQFAEDVLKGLSSNPKKISSKYFYDDSGSRIFQKITTLIDYYPTRAEFEILDSIKDLLPDIVGAGEVDLVELGAGDGHKTKLLIDSFLLKGIRVQYFPIDISEQALHLLENNIPPAENLERHGVVADYIEGLKYVRSLSKNRQIVLFLGSNIGNFSKEESIEMLKRVRELMHERDYLLIGFDLKKNIDVLTRAYNDSEGVTAEFNFNLLRRMNNELGANFDLTNFTHRSIYNPALGAVESFLISLREQDVTFTTLNKTFHFDEFEPIHLEYSFKFLEKEIDDISRNVGFKSVSNFKDHDRLFVDALWQVNS